MAVTSRRPRRRGWLALVVLLGFMLFVVYRSLRIGGVQCEVCITYGGRSQCRSVEGQTEEDARSAATNNVCAFLSSGVTDSIACSRTPPTRAECRPVE